MTPTLIHSGLVLASISKLISVAREAAQAKRATQVIGADTRGDYDLPEDNWVQS